jgi:hypothetical protein
MDAEIEEWRDVHGFLGYQASSFGRIRSKWRCGPRSKNPSGRVLKGRIDVSGYISICVWSVGGRKRGYFAHRMVAIAFIENPHGLPVVAHNDGSRTNNRVSNLRWATFSENSKDRLIHGTQPFMRGEKNGQSKMTDAMVIEARRLFHVCGLKKHEIYKMLDIPEECGRLAILGKSWKHIPMPV